MPEMGRHTSMREERAQKIEWDAQEILALEYMRRYLGDIFEGYIAGVAGMGFFVALKDYPVEGLVRIATVDDDYYDFDEELSVWRGRASGRTFMPGMAVTVLIERIDVLAKQMDLILVRAARGKGKTAKEGTKPRSQGLPRGGQAAGGRGKKSKAHPFMQFMKKKRGRG